jgi:DHA1 family tetracycline resistance protein-like MFS transporter
MRRGDAGVPFVLVVLGLDALGLGLVVPIVPQLVERLSGRNPTGASAAVGALVATFALAQLLAAPILGGLSDRFGRRAVILISVAGSACNYLLLTWAPSVGWLFLGRALAGASAGNTAAATAYIADVSPPELRARRFGLIGAAFSLGFVLGPALGGLLGNVWLRLPFLAAFALTLVNVLYGLFVLPESLPPARRQAFAWRGANPVAAMRLLGEAPGLARLGLVWAALWSGIGTLQTVFVLSTALRFGWGSLRNGLALALVGLTAAAVQGLLVRRAVARLGERRTAFLGLLASAAAYLVLAVAWQDWMVFVGIAMQALGGLATPAVRALVSVSAGPDRQGRVMGALSSIEGMTAIFSPILAATLFRLFAGPNALAELPGMPFLASALIFAAAALLVRAARS